MIAADHLTVKARAAVSRILEDEGKSEMWEVSLWADKVRRLKVPRQPAHNAPLPLGEASINPKAVCKPRGCLLTAIPEGIKILGDPKAALAAKALALNYLVHFLGDIHQPLHTSENAGQWPVLLNGRTMTLHSVWDTRIIQAQSKDSRHIADLAEADPRQVDDGGTPLQWAVEGRNIARDDILAELLAHDQSLRISYEQHKWPIVRWRLKQAGYRLARVLNDIFE